MNLEKFLMKNRAGRISFSILLGLGLAALFRKACENNSCIVVQGPDPADIRKYYYKMDGDCYKYHHVRTSC